MAYFYYEDNITYVEAMNLAYQQIAHTPTLRLQKTHLDIQLFR